MKYIKVALILAVTLLSGELNLAQTGGGYNLTWWTVDGGGLPVSGGGYTLVGTAGQWDAGPALTGGGYVLRGGFWSSGGTSSRIHLPVIRRN